MFDPIDLKITGEVHFFMFYMRQFLFCKIAGGTFDYLIWQGLFLALMNIIHCKCECWNMLVQSPFKTYLFILISLNSVLDF